MEYPQKLNASQKLQTEALTTVSILLAFLRKDEKNPFYILCKTELIDEPGDLLLNTAREIILDLHFYH